MQPINGKILALALLLTGASAFTQLPARVRSSSLKMSTFDPSGGPHAPMERNNNGDLWLPQRARPRRNRKSEGMRSMVRENFVAPCHFIYPLFIHDESSVQEIPSMPGTFRHSLDSMMKEVEEAMGYGVKSFILFPKIPDTLKTNYAEECYNPNGIVPRALSMIKSKFPEAIVCTDIALDPYSDQGHDGVVKDGKILNDETIGQLCKQVTERMPQKIAETAEITHARSAGIALLVRSNLKFCLSRPCARPVREVTLLALRI